MKTDGLGLVRLRVGDVVKVGGGMLVVDHVNESGARVVPLERRTVVVRTRFGDEAKFDQLGKAVHITAHVEPEALVDRRGADWLKTFLASKVAGRKGEAGGRRELCDMSDKEVALGNQAWTSTYSGAASKSAAPQNAVNETKQTTKENEMSKKQKKTKASTEPKQRKPRKAKAAAATNGDSGHYDKIMGYSVCSVVRRLGLEEVSFGHAKAILEANGVKGMTDKSLRVQLWFGKNGKKTIAELTKDQVAELKKSAEEPKQEEAKAA